MTAHNTAKGKKKIRNVRQEMTVNFDVSNVREGMLHGRPHYIVPMVMSIEGVHSGSQGPLLYPSQELRRGTRVWNHKPIVVNHPQKNGRFISACSAEVLNECRIGVVLNAKYDDKQRAEAWIDKELVREKARDIDTAIVNQKPMPVSTGLDTDIELGAGQWNNERYIGVARNHRPDHLAVLINQDGACSLNDGCGLSVTNASTEEPKMKTKKELVDELIANKDSGWKETDRDGLMNFPEARLQELINNVKPAAPPAPAAPAPVANCGCPAPTVPVANTPAPAPAPAAPPAPPVTAPIRQSMTEEEYIQNAPPRMQAMYRRMVAQEEQEKANLIGEITANANNTFNPEWLKIQEVDVLRAIASMAQPAAEPVANAPPVYFGGGGVRPVEPKVTEEALELPTINAFFPKATAGAQ